ncbi:hypothetical protein BDZ91DRAFT_793104 [Kalaharituber pfeilii]|nr:hypothetical protein BDZ91DRAFT_793104 [Kalaharituber pfeilii]
MLLKSITALILIAGSASATQLAAGYQQCGGYNHNGPTHCERGYHCERLNDYFYQCLPGPGTQTSSSIASLATRLPSAPVSSPVVRGTPAPSQSAIYRSRRQQPRETPSPSRVHTQTPTQTPSVPSHLVEFARRDRERRQQASNIASISEILPLYPRPTQTLTAEDINQINLLDDIEREILRYSRNGGLSPNTI